MTNSSVAISVADQSRAAEARRLASGLATEAGFDEGDIGKVALIVTEAATNLFKHATEGQLILQSLCSGNASGLEIMAVDRGPGIANVHECLRDGYSTAGSPGTGLGAISRLSSTFDIYSAPGKGTTMFSEIRKTPSGGAPSISSPASRVRVGCVSIPKPGENVNGDNWAAEETAAGGDFVVVDGLGHGPDAARASNEAVRVFRELHGRPLAEILEAIHSALRPTRGAAIALAHADADEGVVRYMGVGNISGVICSGDNSRQMVSYNGIAGHQILKMHEFVYPWPQDSVIVLHSDGLTSHWSFEPYPGLMLRHPSLIGSVLYRDFCRGRDDVTVLVIGRMEPRA